MKMPKVLLLLIFLLGFSCSRDANPASQKASIQSWMEKNGKIKVLCTTAMISDIVKQVGGEHVDVLTLIEGELDPHSYQLVKGDDEKLAYADIIFSNGLGLEHGPSLQYFLESSPKSIPLGNAILKNQPQKILYLDKQVDPHLWMDVGLWTETIPIIITNLKNKNPQHTAAYESNGNQLMKELKELHQHILNELQKIPTAKRYLVTSHDAFNYFAQAYLVDHSNPKDNWETRFHAPEGLAPESQLSTADIQRTIDFILKYDIHTLFPESNVSKDSIRKIVEAGNEKGMKLMMAPKPLYGDAMGAPSSGAGTYKQMLLYNTETIVRYLRDPHE